MKRIQLFSGELDDKIVSSAEDHSQLEKKVMLVYTGKFNSLDGEVEIKDEDIEKLATNHNGMLASLKRLAVGDVPVKHYPPLQLDHSTSAKDTVGRLVGDLEVGEHTTPEGKYKALFGKVRILGKENVEKVMDGRWTHVSIGADLESHKITELTITPFPAAADASLLSSKRLGWEAYEYNGPNKRFKILLRDDDPARCKVELDGKVSREFSLDRHPTDGAIKELIPEIEKKSGFKLASARLEKKIDKTIKHKGYEIDIFEMEDGGFVSRVNEKPGEMVHSGESEQEVIKKAKDYLDRMIKNGYLSKLSKGVTEMSYKEMQERMAQYEKCKKHLMDEKKMSEDDAEKHLGEMEDEDVKKMAEEHDAKMSKLAAEEEEKKKLAEAEEEKKKTEMSSHREKLVQLAKSTKAVGSKITLTQRKAKLSARLSALKASAKIAPAELKKLDLEDLAKKSDEAIDVALSLYENREPLVPVGLYGTTKALSGAQLSGALRKLQMERLELETRLNMPSKREAALKRLAEVQEEMKKMEGEVSIHVDAPAGDHPTEMSSHDMAYESMKKLMDEGKLEEAKQHFMSYMKKVMSAQAPAEMSSESTDKQLSALAEDFKKLQTDVVEFGKLIAPQIGLDPKELS